MITSQSETSHERKYIRLTTLTTFNRKMGHSLSSTNDIIVLFNCLLVILFYHALVDCNTKRSIIHSYCCTPYIIDSPSSINARQPEDALLGCLLPFLSNCWVTFGRPSYIWAVLPGVPRHWRVPPASGVHPPGFRPLCGVYCLAPEAPLKRGMPTRPRVFLALPDAYGLRLCVRTHFKKGLVPYLSGGGTENK